MKKQNSFEDAFVLIKIPSPERLCNHKGPKFLCNKKKGHKGKHTAYGYGDYKVEW